MRRHSRRSFLLAAGVAALAAPRLRANTRRPTLSVLTDELSQDFGRALEVASHDLGLGAVEIRSLWGKNALRLDETEVAEAKRLLERAGLRASAVASPLFKTAWPGAAKTGGAPARDRYGADFGPDEQDEALERGLACASALGTRLLRCFDFRRLDDVASYRAAIDEGLRAAADRAAASGITLVLKNEPSCNTSSAAEVARTLSAVDHPSLKLNWDPGNSAWAGETPFPDAYAALPKEKIVLVHCKDVRVIRGERDWVAVGDGVVDWRGVLRALRQDGFAGCLTIETLSPNGGEASARARKSASTLERLVSPDDGSTH